MLLNMVQIINVLKDYGNSIIWPITSITNLVPATVLILNPPKKMNFQ